MSDAKLRSGAVWVSATNPARSLAKGLPLGRRANPPFLVFAERSRAVTDDNGRITVGVPALGLRYRLEVTRRGVTQVQLVPAFETPLRGHITLRE